MQISRTSWSLIQARIDPQFYHPQNLLDISKIMQFDPIRLEDLRSPKTKISYGVLKPRFISSGFKLARIQNFADPFLNIDSCEEIEEGQFLEYLRSESQEGDLLIAIGGYVGRVAIVPALSSRLNINQHIARLRPRKDSGIDSYFLAIYLISSIGRRQLTRYVSGSVQAGINLEDLRELPIPKPHVKAQTYIGDKVRQAERLRERAKYFLHQARLDFLSLLPDFPLEMFVGPAGRINYRDSLGGVLHKRISCRDVQDRLDARAYNPYAFESLQYLKRRGKYIRLQQAVSSMSTGISGLEYSEQGLAIILTKDITSDGISKDLRRIINNVAESELVSTNDCLLTTYGGPSIGKVGLVRGWAVGCSYDYTVLRLKADGVNIRPGFLFLVLQSALFQHQLASNIKGTTGITFTLTSDIKDFLIPLVSKDDQQEIEKKCIRSVDAQQNSVSLTEAAKQLVEALIEGHLTEAELKAAQEALERGDRSLDREILKRLTRKGIDVKDEPPLFADLDALYQALDDE